MLDELDLHVTNRCTTSCEYCCFSSNRLALDELSTEEFKNVISQAYELGCKHLHFTGGEPLVRKDIIELISFAAERKMDIRMQTNGMLLDVNTAIALKNAGLNSIMISLDSSSSEIHDANRGRGTWQAALEAIKVSLNVFDQVRVNSVLTNTNKDNIFDTIQFVKKLGVTNYSAFYFSPIGCGRGRYDLWIPPEEYLSFWKDLQERIISDTSLSDMNIIIEKAYADWNEAKEIDVSEFTGCGGGCLNTYYNRDYLIVRCDGSVYPCILAIDSPSLGNVRQLSLDEIHKNSPMWNKLLPVSSKKCREECEHYALCGGGCRYYPQNEFEEDKRCIYNKLVPLCPIMKYNSKNQSLGGSSEDVMK